MATKYNFADHTTDNFERTIQINNNDYIFKMQYITIKDHIGEAFGFWNCQISDSSGKILLNTPVVFNSPLFKFSKPSSLNGNFVFIQDEAEKKKSEPAYEDFKNRKAFLYYYEQ